MDQQIVNPDPGLNYNVAILTCDLHFKMEKNIIIIAVKIVTRLWIVMLNDIVLSHKNLVQFWWFMNHKEPKNVLTALASQSEVSWMF